MCLLCAHPASAAKGQLRLSAARSGGACTWKVKGSQGGSGQLPCLPLSLADSRALALGKERQRLVPGNTLTFSALEECYL